MSSLRLKARGVRHGSILTASIHNEDFFESQGERVSERLRKRLFFVERWNNHTDSQRPHVRHGSHRVFDVVTCSGPMRCDHYVTGFESLNIKNMTMTMVNQKTTCLCQKCISP